MSNQIQFSEIASVLKPLLRKRGISYRQLAEHLKLSESSIKKLFISNDCSLQRLTAICDLLEVDVVELMTAARERPPERMKFSDTQQNFLLENETCFKIYWKLVYEEVPQEEIRAFLKISKSLFSRYLRQLDKHDLIKVGADDKVVLPDMNMVLWTDEGPLVKEYKRKWSHELVDKVSPNSNRPDFHLAIRYYKFTPTTLSEFKQAIIDLELEFGRRSVREIKMNAPGLTNATTISAIAPVGFFDEVDS